MLAAIDDHHRRRPTPEIGRLFFMQHLKVAQIVHRTNTVGKRDLHVKNTCNRIRNHMSASVFAVGMATREQTLVQIPKVNDLYAQTARLPLAKTVLLTVPLIRSWLGRATGAPARCPPARSTRWTV